ncbi:MAG: hypothetical protein Q8N98_04955, partial [bacterium]|nr:hypothetical protein [bacterium]
LYDVDLDENKELLNKFKKIEPELYLSVIIPFIILYILAKNLEMEMYIFYGIIVLFIYVIFIVIYIFTKQFEAIKTLGIFNKYRINRIIDGHVVEIFVLAIGLILGLFLILNSEIFMENYAYNLYWKNFPDAFNTIYDSYKNTPNGVPTNFNVYGMINIVSIIHTGQDFLTKMSNLLSYLIIIFPAIVWLVLAKIYSGFEKILISASLFILGILIQRSLSFVILGGTLDIIIIG